MVKTSAVQTAQTNLKIIRRMIPLSIFKGIAEKNKVGVQDYISTYDNFIWALARKFTASTFEAEAAAQEIFIDIWRYSESSDNPPTDEQVLEALVARKRLINYLQ